VAQDFLTQTSYAFTKVVAAESLVPIYRICCKQKATIKFGPLISPALSPQESRAK